MTSDNDSIYSEDSLLCSDEKVLDEKSQPVAMATDIGNITDSVVAMTAALDNNTKTINQIPVKNENVLTDKPSEGSEELCIEQDSLENIVSNEMDVSDNLILASASYTATDNITNVSHISQSEHLKDLSSRSRSGMDMWHAAEPKPSTDTSGQLLSVEASDQDADVSMDSLEMDSGLSVSDVPLRSSSPMSSSSSSLHHSPLKTHPLDRSCTPSSPHDASLVGVSVCNSDQYKHLSVMPVDHRSSHADTHHDPSKVMVKVTDEIDQSSVIETDTDIFSKVSENILTADAEQKLNIVSPLTDNVALCCDKQAPGVSPVDVAQITDISQTVEKDSTLVNTNFDKIIDSKESKAVMTNDQASQLSHKVTHVDSEQASVKDTINKQRPMNDDMNVSSIQGPSNETSTKGVVSENVREDPSSETSNKGVTSESARLDLSSDAKGIASESARVYLSSDAKGIASESARVDLSSEAKGLASEITRVDPNRETPTKGVASENARVDSSSETSTKGLAGESARTDPSSETSASSASVSALKDSGINSPMKDVMYESSESRPESSLDQSISDSSSDVTGMSSMIESSESTLSADTVIYVPIEKEGEKDTSGEMASPRADTDDTLSEADSLEAGLTVENEVDNPEAGIPSQNEVVNLKASLPAEKEVDIDKIVKPSKMANLQPEMTVEHIHKPDSREVEKADIEENIEAPNVTITDSEKIHKTDVASSPVAMAKDAVTSDRTLATPSDDKHISKGMQSVISNEVSSIDDKLIKDIKVSSSIDSKLSDVAMTTDIPEVRDTKSVQTPLENQVDTVVHTAVLQSVHPDLSGADKHAEHMVTMATELDGSVDQTTENNALLAHPCLGTQKSLSDDKVSLHEIEIEVNIVSEEADQAETVTLREPPQKNDEDKKKNRDSGYYSLTRESESLSGYMRVSDTLTESSEKSDSEGSDDVYERQLSGGVFHDDALSPQQQQQEQTGEELLSDVQEQQQQEQPGEGLLSNAQQQQQHQQDQTGEGLLSDAQQQHQQEQLGEVLSDTQQQQQQDQLEEVLSDAQKQQQPSGVSLIDDPEQQPRVSLDTQQQQQQPSGVTLLDDTQQPSVPLDTQHQQQQASRVPFDDTHQHSGVPLDDTYQQQQQPGGVPIIDGTQQQPSVPLDTHQQQQQQPSGVPIIDDTQQQPSVPLDTHQQQQQPGGVPIIDGTQQLRASLDDTQQKQQQQPGGVLIIEGTQQQPSVSLDTQQQQQPSGVSIIDDTQHQAGVCDDTQQQPSGVPLDDTQQEKQKQPSRLLLIDDTQQPSGVPILDVTQQQQQQPSVVCILDDTQQPRASLIQQPSGVPIFDGTQQPSVSIDIQQQQQPSGVPILDCAQQPSVSLDTQQQQQQQPSGVTIINDTQQQTRVSLDDTQPKQQQQPGGVPLLDDTQQQPKVSLDDTQPKQKQQPGGVPILDDTQQQPKVSLDDTQPKQQQRPIGVPILDDTQQPRVSLDNTQQQQQPSGVPIIDDAQHQARVCDDTQQQPSGVPLDDTLQQPSGVPIIDDTQHQARVSDSIEQQPSGVHLDDTLQQHSGVSLMDNTQQARVSLDGTQQQQQQQIAQQQPIAWSSLSIRQIQQEVAPYVENMTNSAIAMAMQEVSSEDASKDGSEEQDSGNDTAFEPDHVQSHPDIEVASESKDTDDLPQHGNEAKLDQHQQRSILEADQAAKQNSTHTVIDQTQSAVKEGNHAAGLDLSSHHKHLPATSTQPTQAVNTTGTTDIYISHLDNIDQVLDKNKDTDNTVVSNEAGHQPSGTDHSALITDKDSTNSKSTQSDDQDYTTEKIPDLANQCQSLIPPEIERIEHVEKVGVASGYDVVARESGAYQVQPNAIHTTPQEVYEDLLHINEKNVAEGSNNDCEQSGLLKDLEGSAGTLDLHLQLAPRSDSPLTYDGYQRGQSIDLEDSDTPRDILLESLPISLSARQVVSDTIAQVVGQYVSDYPNIATHYGTDPTLNYHTHQSNEANNSTPTGLFNDKYQVETVKVGSAEPSKVEGVGQIQASHVSTLPHVAGINAPETWSAADKVIDVITCDQNDIASSQSDGQASPVVATHDGSERPQTDSESDMDNDEQVSTQQPAAGSKGKIQNEPEIDSDENDNKMDINESSGEIENPENKDRVITKAGVLPIDTAGESKTTQDSRERSQEKHKDENIMGNVSSIQPIVEAEINVPIIEAQDGFDKSKEAVGQVPRSDEAAAAAAATAVGSPRLLPSSDVSLPSGGQLTPPSGGKLDLSAGLEVDTSWDEGYGTMLMAANETLDSTFENIPELSHHSPQLPSSSGEQQHDAKEAAGESEACSIDDLTKTDRIVPTRKISDDNSSDEGPLTLDDLSADTEQLTGDSHGDTKLNLVDDEMSDTPEGTVSTDIDLPMSEESSSLGVHEEHHDTPPISPASTPRLLGTPAASLDRDDSTDLSAEATSLGYSALQLHPVAEDMEVPVEEAYPADFHDDGTYEVVHFKAPDGASRKPGIQQKIEKLELARDLVRSQIVMLRTADFLELVESIPEDMTYITELGTMSADDLQLEHFEGEVATLESSNVTPNMAVPAPQSQDKSESETILNGNISQSEKESDASLSHKGKPPSLGDAADHIDDVALSAEDANYSSDNYEEDSSAEETGQNETSQPLDHEVDITPGVLPRLHRSSNSSIAVNVGDLPALQDLKEECMSVTLDQGSLDEVEEEPGLQAGEDDDNDAGSDMLQVIDSVARDQSDSASGLDVPTVSIEDKLDIWAKVVHAEQLNTALLPKRGSMASMTVNVGDQDEVPSCDEDDVAIQDDQMSTDELDNDEADITSKERDEEQTTLPEQDAGISAADPDQLTCVTLLPDSLSHIRKSLASEQGSLPEIEEEPGLQAGADEDEGTDSCMLQVMDSATDKAESDVPNAATEVKGDLWDNLAVRDPLQVNLAFRDSIASMTVHVGDQDREDIVSDDEQQVEVSSEIDQEKQPSQEDDGQDLNSSEYISEIGDSEFGVSEITGSEVGVSEYSMNGRVQFYISESEIEAHKGEDMEVDDEILPEDIEEEDEPEASDEQSEDVWAKVPHSVSGHSMPDAMSEVSLLVQVGEQDEVDMSDEEDTTGEVGSKEETDMPADSHIDVWAGIKDAIEEKKTMVHKISTASMAVHVGEQENIEALSDIESNTEDETEKYSHKHADNTGADNRDDSETVIEADQTENETKMAKTEKDYQTKPLSGDKTQTELDTVSDNVKIKDSSKAVDKEPTAHTLPLPGQVTQQEDEPKFDEPSVTAQPHSDDNTVPKVAQVAERPIELAKQLSEGALQTAYNRQPSDDNIKPHLQLHELPSEDTLRLPESLNASRRSSSESSWSMMVNTGMLTPTSNQISRASSVESTWSNAPNVGEPLEVTLQDIEETDQRGRSATDSTVDTYVTASEGNAQLMEDVDEDLTDIEVQVPSSVDEMQAYLSGGFKPKSKTQNADDLDNLDEALPEDEPLGESEMRKSVEDLLGEMQKERNVLRHGDSKDSTTVTTPNISPEHKPKPSAVVEVGTPEDAIMEVEIGQESSTSPIIEQTNDMPVLDQTRDKLVTEQTEHNPVSEQTHNESEQAQDKLESTQTQDMPVSEQTEDKPVSEQTHHKSVLEQTQDKSVSDSLTVDTDEPEDTSRPVSQDEGAGLSPMDISSRPDSEGEKMEDYLRKFLEQHVSKMDKSQSDSAIGSDMTDPESGTVSPKTKRLAEVSDMLTKTDLEAVLSEPTKSVIAEGHEQSVTVAHVKAEPPRNKSQDSNSAGKVMFPEDSNQELLQKAKEAAEHSSEKIEESEETPSRNEHDLQGPITAMVNEDETVGHLLDQSGNSIDVQPSRKPHIEQLDLSNTKPLADGDQEGHEKSPKVRTPGSKDVVFVDTQVMGFDVPPDQVHPVRLSKDDEHQQLYLLSEHKMNFDGHYNKGTMESDIQIMGIQPTPANRPDSPDDVEPPIVYSEDPTALCHQNLTHSALNIEIKPWRLAKSPSKHNDTQSAVEEIPDTATVTPVDTFGQVPETGTKSIDKDEQVPETTTATSVDTFLQIPETATTMPADNLNNLEQAPETVTNNAIDKSGQVPETVTTAPVDKSDIASMHDGDPEKETHDRLEVKLIKPVFQAIPSDTSIAEGQMEEADLQDEESMETDQTLEMEKLQQANKSEMDNRQQPHVNLQAAEISKSGQTEELQKASNSEMDEGKTAEADLQTTEVITACQTEDLQEASKPEHESTGLEVTDNLDDWQVVDDIQPETVVEEYEVLEAPFIIPPEYTGEVPVGYEAVLESDLQREAANVAPSSDRQSLDGEALVPGDDSHEPTKSQAEDSSVVKPAGLGDKSQAEQIKPDDRKTPSSVSVKEAKDDILVEERQPKRNDRGYADESPFEAREPEGETIDGYADGSSEMPQEKTGKSQIAPTTPHNKHTIQVNTHYTYYSLYR